MDPKRTTLIGTTEFDRLEAEARLKAEIEAAAAAAGGEFMRDAGNVHAGFGDLYENRAATDFGDVEVDPLLVKHGMERELARGQAIERGAAGQSALQRPIGTTEFERLSEEEAMRALFESRLGGRE